MVKVPRFKPLVLMDNEVAMEEFTGVIALGVTAVTNAITAKLVGATQTALNDILQEALERVPVEFGNLYASGRVVLEEFEGGASGSVSFGDSGDVYYAAIVHEILWYYHEVGQAKYLEAGARAAADRVLNRLTKELDKIAQ